jgi:DNA sulfur modification protein DndD
MEKKDYNKHIQSRLHRNLDGSRAPYASIALEFDYARSGYVDNFLIKRSWKYTDQEIVEVLDIHRNNEPLVEVNEEQWQNFLMELIPPGLSKLFFFDGEKIQSLARGQGENRYILESINSLLGIDLIERLRYDIKMYLAKESTNNAVGLEASLCEIKNRRKSIELRLDSLLQEKASMQNKMMRVNSEIENQELQISTDGGGFASQREQLKDKAKTLEAKIESTKEEIRDLCAGLLPFAIVPEFCKTLKSRLEHEEKEQQRQAAITYLNNMVNELSEDIGKALFFDVLRLSKDEKHLVASETIKILRGKIEKVNGFSKENIHAVSSIERLELLRWIQVATDQIPSNLKELSSRLAELESENEITRGYIFNAPSDDVLKPFFIKLGQLHEELGTLQQKQAITEKEIESIKLQLTIILREQDKLLNEKTQFDKSIRRLELAAKTQDVLEEYLQRLRTEKVGEFRENFLECFNLLFGKQNLVSNVDVSASNFEITLLTSQNIPLPRVELSLGERQIYAMAMIWALAKTSNRLLPFLMDTPLGRLDTDHRKNIMDNFLLNASHQIIVFSTNTEIDQHYYDQLQPYIAKAYNLEYDSDKRETTVKQGYFWKSLEVEKNEL